MNSIIAWFSCGVTSAIACKIALDNYGDRVRVVYIEIDSAHEDNERFIADCERWYDVKIERIRSEKYRDQFDVIEKSRFINGAFGAKCTLELKKEVRWKYENENSFESQVFGFEYAPKEINRAIRFEQEYSDTKPSFPLIQRKLTKEMCADILLKSGIALPVMYELGYHNNNCIGCVKGGMGYWNKIRLDFPEVFLRMSEKERGIQRSCLKQPDGDPVEVEIDGVMRLKQKYKPLFLSELDSEAGRHEPPIMPDCGTFCEIENADLISPKVNQVIESDLKVGQLSFGWVI